MGLANDFAEAREALRAGDDGKLKTFFEKYRRVKQDQGGKFANETFVEFKTRIINRFGIAVKKIDDDDYEDDAYPHPSLDSNFEDGDD